MYPTCIYSVFDPALVAIGYDIPVFGVPQDEVRKSGPGLHLFLMCVEHESLHDSQLTLSWQVWYSLYAAAHISYHRGFPMSPWMSQRRQPQCSGTRSGVAPSWDGVRRTADNTLAEAAACISINHLGRLLF